MRETVDTKTKVDILRELQCVQGHSTVFLPSQDGGVWSQPVILVLTMYFISLSVVSY